METNNPQNSEKDDIEMQIPAGDDSRRHRRIEIDSEAWLRLPGGSSAARLGNISIGGLLVTLPNSQDTQQLQPGEHVVVDAPGLIENTRCNVVGVSKQGLHLAFESNPDFSLKDLARIREQGNSLTQARRLRLLAQDLTGIALIEIEENQANILQSSMPWLPENGVEATTYLQTINQLRLKNTAGTLGAQLNALIPDAPKLSGTVLFDLNGKEQTLVFRAQKVASGNILLALHDRTDHFRQQKDIELLSHDLAGETENHSRDIASLAHDLRSPMGAIRGYAELLALEMHGPLNAKQLNALETIMQATDRLTEMVADILKSDASRQMSPSSNFPRQTTGGIRAPIGDIVNGVIRLFANQATQKGISLALEAHPESLAYEMDNIRMRRIITNLVTNAINHTDQGGIIIRLTNDVGALTLEVEDTGIGIPREVAARVFEASFKHGERRGSGLGLWIVNTLIQEMAGHVALESIPGQGTKVICHIPLSA